MKSYKDYTLEELLDELAQGRPIEKANELKAQILKRFRLLEAHSGKTETKAG
mgnify:CR=1 FL=1